MVGGRNVVCQARQSATRLVSWKLLIEIGFPLSIQRAHETHRLSGRIGLCKYSGLLFFDTVDNKYEYKHKHKLEYEHKPVYDREHIHINKHKYKHQHCNSLPGIIAVD
jgi:hypothetical protein